MDLTLDRERLHRVRHGSAVAVDRPAVFRVSGAGALSCLQGLFTSDLEKPGDGSFSYGAMLTPKGMIVVDAWIARQGATLTLVAPARGRESVQGIFQRGLPPRLARAEDVTDSVAAAWVLGERGLQTLAHAGTGLPEGAGRVLEGGGAGDGMMVALAPDGAPFGALVLGPAQAVETAARRLQLAGALRGDERDFHAARILAGWPGLGVEIDGKTLPQEVRYDEIGGVSYTKGCYTGQETVARLHFRGHTNRELRGLAWREPGAPAERSVVVGEKEVGSVRSTLSVDGRTVGLAIVRREVGPGSEVMAGGRVATVVRLPFGEEVLDA